jgi:hypothetical protein
MKPYKRISKKNGILIYKLSSNEIKGAWKVSWPRSLTILTTTPQALRNVLIVDFVKKERIGSSLIIRNILFMLKLSFVLKQICSCYV